MFIANLEILVTLAPTITQSKKITTQQANGLLLDILFLECFLFTLLPGKLLCNQGGAPYIRTYWLLP